MNLNPIAKTITLLPQQSAVVNWVMNGKGSLELLARAGCGKTFTLIEVVKTIVENRLGDIYLTAFNRAIADELADKLKRHGIEWRQAQANTAHGFGSGAWRRAAPQSQLNEDKVISIIRTFFETTDDRLYLTCMGLLKKYVSTAKAAGFGIPRAGYPKTDDRAAWYKLWTHYDLEVELADLVDENGCRVSYGVEEITDAAIKIYNKSLSICREVIDFDDMILAPLVHKAFFFKKKWVLIDESQDTNGARRALAMEMLAPGGRMIFVGDDRQAIYGFTGADADAMALLREVTKAKTLPLNVTMRCPKSVVALAQHFVPDITAHENAPEGIVRSLGQYEELLAQNLTFEDAILCRNTAPLLKTAFFLLGKGIPCQVEGRDIAETLVKMASRWKAKNLEQYLKKLDEYQEAQTKKLLEKKKESLVDRLVDQLECLRIIVAECQAQGKHKVDDLINKIYSMFGERDARKPILTLSTIHKSKGREWKRVFALGRQEFLPSPWAKQEWQQVQEANLEYVMITRSMGEFIDVPAPPKEDKKGK
jgi:DNA helicase II / ATP-dependent DNA helicase PcrA